MILLHNLKAQHDSIRKELDSAINSVIEKSQFISGDFTKEFEKNFAAFCNKPYCVGSSNGSTALFAALKCLGIKQGDEVILPANTFIATAFAVTLCGAKPIFVDVNESDSLINTDLIEKSITKKTKAIIPVHLYGGVCEMDRIIEIAKKNNLLIVEDCAQAHGSKYKGKIVPITDIGTFSFFPAKNLGALGDAGAIVSSNEEFVEKCRMFVNHGRLDKYFHSIEGFNFRLVNLQAGILNVKLKYLNSWLKNKRKVAAAYDKELIDAVGLMKTTNDVEHSYHLYVIKTSQRNKLQEYLKNKGIETGVHYPVPLHLQPVFNYLGHKEGNFPIAERLSKEILSIPIYSELTDSNQQDIIINIKEFFKENS